MKIKSTNGQVEINQIGAYVTISVRSDSGLEGMDEYPYMDSSSVIMSPSQAIKLGDRLLAIAVKAMAVQHKDCS